MLTVFGTVLPLIAGPATQEDVVRLTKLTPHERFAHGLHLLNDGKLLRDYETFLDNYEKFLRWKESMGTVATSSRRMDKKAKQTAEDSRISYTGRLLTDELRRI